MNLNNFAKWTNNHSDIILSCKINKSCFPNTVYNVLQHVQHVVYQNLSVNFFIVFFFTVSIMSKVTFLHPPSRKQHLFPQDIQYIRTLPSWVHGRSNVLMNFIGTSVNLRVWQDKAWRFFLTLESCYLPWDLEKKDKQIPANYTRMTRRTSAKQNSRFY